MPTIEQIRAARALLGWSQSDLAAHAGLSQTGIARIENGTNQPNSQTIAKIESAFDKADVEFLDITSVRKRTGEIRTLHGAEGFRYFLDEIYNEAKSKGGLFCLHNARPNNWYKWVGKEFYETHAQRMTKVMNNFELRITCKEGETQFISKDFAEYRLLPAHMFNEQSIYAFGNRLAFIHFEDNKVTVRLLDNKAFADGFRALFNVAWENVAFKPD